MHPQSAHQLSESGTEDASFYLDSLYMKNILQYVLDNYRCFCHLCSKVEWPPYTPEPCLGPPCV